MAPLFRVKRLFPKTSSKEPSVQERPASADGTSSNSARSREGSVMQHSEPVAGGETTPNSSLQSSASVTSLPKLLSTASDSHVPQSKRPFSMSGMPLNRRSVTGLPSPAAAGQVGQKLPNAFYSPRVTNIEDGATVFNKMTLVQGVCGNPEQAGHLLDGCLRVTYSHKQIPRQEFSVHGGVFKFTAYLVPGRNKITLEFFSSKLKDNNIGSVSNQAAVLQLFHIPATSTPPLRLAILVASDSPHTIDSTPERTQLEGNGLGTAIAKSRMMAQMSQAALAEYMSRSEMGARSFRLEEEWTTGSSLREDMGMTAMRNEPKVHIVQTKCTVEELKELAERRSEQEMVAVALEALEMAMPSAPSHTEHVAMIVLDSHWDAAKGVNECHFNTVGGNDAFRVSLLGSQFLWSIPSYLEDIEMALADCTRLDGKYSAEGIGTASSVWEMADMMLNAYFRNILRLFGCEEKSAGINSCQKEQHVSRSFLSRESFGITSKNPGIRCVTREHESQLHKLDALHLRFHPNFAIPPDEPVVPASCAFVWPVKNKNLVITSSAGIVYLEIFAGNDTIPCGFLDYASVHTSRLPNGGAIIDRLRGELTVSETALRNAMPQRAQKEKLKLVVHSYAAKPTVVHDVSTLCEKNDSVVKHPKIKAFRSFKVGNTLAQGATEEEVIWDNAVDLHAVMKAVKIYFDDNRIYGIEICSVDSNTQLFGNRGEKALLGPSSVRVDIIDLDTRLAEMPTGFVIWTSDTTHVAGIQIITSKGMYSPRYGNFRTVNPYRALAPRGYTLAGLSGAVGEGIENIRLLIKISTATRKSRN